MSFHIQVLMFESTQDAKLNQRNDSEVKNNKNGDDQTKICDENGKFQPD